MVVGVARGHLIPRSFGGIGVVVQVHRNRRCRLRVGVNDRYRIGRKLVVMHFRQCMGVRKIPAQVLHQGKGRTLTKPLLMQHDKGGRHSNSVPYGGNVIQALDARGWRCLGKAEWGLERDRTAELANGVGIRRGCSQNVGGLLVATGGGMNAIFADTLQGEYRITPALGYPQNGLPGRFKFWAG